MDEPDYTIQVNLTMEVLGDGVTYAMFNGKTFRPPKVPSLYTVLSTHGNTNLTTNELIYGTNTNSFVLQGDEVVEIILNNMDQVNIHFIYMDTIFKSFLDLILMMKIIN